MKSGAYGFAAQPLSLSATVDIVIVCCFEAMAGSGHTAILIDMRLVPRAIVLHAPHVPGRADVLVQQADP